MAIVHPTNEERAALCEWLTANGIDINLVPEDSDFAITTKPGGARVIQYTTFVRDEQTGNILADPATHDAMRQESTAPCTVDPPAWLNIPGRSR